MSLHLVQVEIWVGLWLIHLVVVVVVVVSVVVIAVARSIVAASTSAIPRASSPVGTVVVAVVIASFTKGDGQDGQQHDASENLAELHCYLTRGWL